MSAGQAINHYNERDGVEKIFKSGKTELEIDAIRAHLDSTTLGRHIVGFVALSIMAELKKGMSATFTETLPGGKTKDYSPMIDDYWLYKLLQASPPTRLIQYGDKAAVSEVTGKQKLLLRRAGFAEAYSAPLPDYCKI